MVESLEIEATAKEKLRNSGYTELKQAVCQYDQCGHSLTLRGDLSLFYWKQLAHELVRGIKHVEQVINMIEIKDR